MAAAILQSVVGMTYLFNKVYPKLGANYTQQLKCVEDKVLSLHFPESNKG